MTHQCITQQRKIGYSSHSSFWVFAQHKKTRIQWGRSPRLHFESQLAGALQNPPPLSVNVGGGVCQFAIQQLPNMV
jgi:hypothetical protein